MRSNYIKTIVVSLSKKLYPHSLVLVGSRNGFEGYLTFELKQIEGLVVDGRQCQISFVV